MTLRLGILARPSPQSYALRMAVKELGYQVGYCEKPSFREARLSLKPDVDGWIIPRDPVAPDMLASHPFIDTHRQPVVFLDTEIPTLVSARYDPWKYDLARKLSECRLRHARLSRREAATRVWVLAASTGGVEVAGKFLADVSPDLDVAFLYVQHIAERHVDQLLRMVERRSEWRADVGRDGLPLYRGQVTVVSPAAKLHIEKGGTLRLMDFPWQGQYSPNIDDVAGQVAREFGARCGMIVFTGMGYDGVVGSRMIRHRGGQVWVQEPGSCAAPAMPEAVLEAQAVDFVGPVEELARHFNETMAGDGSRLAAEGS